MKKNIIRFLRILITYISPVLNTKVNFYFTMKKKLDLKNPKWLDEKIQWLKFNTYYDNKKVRDCVDKYKVREYVEECGCREILNDLYGVWDNVEDIDWEKLPNKFVIKWNFGCGQNLIVRDKSKLDIMEASDKLKSWKKESNTFYKVYAEMQYRGIKPKLICERFIEPDTGTLPVDYKVYCFNGVAKYVMLCVGRSTDDVNFYFFDKDMKLQRFDIPSLKLPSDFSMEKPDCYDSLFTYANKLSQGFPFVRVDFYIEKNKVIFGELTFTPCGGMDKSIIPDSNAFLGSLVKLPK